MTDGEEAQWVEWYRSLERPLYNLAYRWLWDAAESQDVVQEAFLRCWRIRERIVTESFRALIYRTTLRLASNRARKRKRWGLIPFVEGRAGSCAEAGGTADPLASAAVRQALSELSEPMKRVLLLSEVGGLSYKEIASVMRISEGTVGSRRARALARLRERLAAQGVEWCED